MQKYDQRSQKMMRALVRAIILFGCTISLMAIAISCSPKKIMIKEMTGLMQDGMKTFEKDSDVEMLKKAMPSHIKLAEAMLSQSPDNRDLKILLAQLYGAYAFSFEETDYEERYLLNNHQASALKSDVSEKELKQNLTLHYLKGSEYALDILAQKYPAIKTSIGNYSQRSQLLSKLTVDDVPALFWYGFNLAGYVSRNLDSVKAMAKASQIEPVMQRIIALSPNYYYGTAHMVLMIFNAVRPPMMGGNLESAQNHYQALKTIVGNKYLLADVLYARYCLTRQQDRESFENIISQISEVSVGSSDALALFNQVAVKRAQIYSKAVDNLFDE